MLLSITVKDNEYQVINSNMSNNSYCKITEHL